LIKNADVVHIHFARDLVSFLAAFLSIFNKKPFVSQTHGMIISDGRINTRVTDLFLTKPLINRTRINLVLTEIEMSSIKALNIKSLSKILPNGIATNYSSNLPDLCSNRIVFCSRLDKRKGIDKFIELADSYRGSDLSFEIYGPDGGELKFVKSEITNRSLEHVIKYKGSLPAGEVSNVLKNATLLVLPSRNEPYPMVVLEALAVGTPVLIMPSCGLAQELEKFDTNYVAKSETVAGIMESFDQQYIGKFRSKSKSEIQTFCNERFNIQSICKTLEMIYKNAIKIK
jgi:glycosyltransferase involved in cell wall biosynthesis